MKKSEIDRTIYNPIAVDMVGLQTILGCGKESAAAMASSAGAIIRIGRRKLYNVDKIRLYLDSISTSA